MANQKGGVGKTTTVASLGAALAELGRRVLLVDLDPQACLTFAVGLDSGEVVLSAYDVLADGIPAIMAVRSTLDGPDLLPATIDLAACEALLAPVHGREQRLRTALAPLADRYDDVLVDCPPTLGLLTLNGLTAADELLVPVQAETLAFRGVDQLLDTVEDEVQRLYNPGLRVRGALPTQYDSRATHGREILAALSDKYGMTVLEPAIPRSVRFAEAPAAGRSVLATARRTRGAHAYRALARNLLAARTA